MDTKYPTGARVKHRTLNDLYGTGTVTRTFYDPNAQEYVHLMMSESGDEWFAFVHSLEPAYD